MSVISTIITSMATVHATDSLLTKLSSNGDREPLEWQNTKIIPVPAWRGAMSYWGFALIEQRWSTLDWLQEQAERASGRESPEAFAKALAIELNNKFTELRSKFRFQRDTDMGTGIHFSAYERINDYWIPELFLISNWFDETYTKLNPKGFTERRETFGTLMKVQPKPNHGCHEYRLIVGNALQEGSWFKYNNGDPHLYNPVANAILEMCDKLACRHMLRETDIETLRALARQPVEVVSNIQRDFCLPGTRLVGGKIHDLVITPAGEYSSKSGDAP